MVCINFKMEGRPHHLFLQVRVELEWVQRQEH